MNITFILLGLFAALILVVLARKWRRYRTREEIDVNTHELNMAEENGDLRVWAGGNSYLNKGIHREGFLKQYREAWSRVRLNFEPLSIGNDTIEFSPAESFMLKQKIVLSWVYVYNVNSRRFKFLFWNLSSDSDSRRDILRAAEQKYGTKSEKAIALAAHTLNMNVKKFKAWMTRDEELQSMW